MKDKKPSGQHAFDKVCADMVIEHRLAPPRHLQTNGMVERFNGRISELLKQTRFDSRADLETTLLNYLKLYNHHIPQRPIGTKTRQSKRSKNGSNAGRSYSSNASTIKRDSTIIDGHLIITQEKTKQPLRIIIRGELAELIERIEERKEAHSVVTVALLTNMHGKRQTADGGGASQPF
jgi:hypothetical protein